MSKSFEDRVRSVCAKSGDTVAAGVHRIVVVIDQRGGTTTSDHNAIWIGRLEELPSDEKLKVTAEGLSHTPLQMRAMFELFKPAYELKPRTRTLAQLVDALGVDQAMLVQALAPLVAKETVRSLLTPDGEEAYSLERIDLFLLQLSLA